MPRPNGRGEPGVASLGELRLIERIRNKVRSAGGKNKAKASVVEGIGDDTAVLRWGDGEHLLLLTCDTLVEKVHFEKGTAPYRIGWKAMACNLSDIAAMGGIPQYALVSLACPRHTTVAAIDKIYAGMIELADRFGVAIVGGDTVESPRGLIVTVALVGKVEENRYVSRAGARPGDVLCVTGDLGGSLLGKHLAFSPRVEEGRFLAMNCSPTAMIDVSDGLASDLTKMVQASHASAEIFAEAVPISEAAIRFAKGKRISPIRAALYDGEDFELLFALGRDKADERLALFRKNFSTPVSVIGAVKKGKARPALIDKNGRSVALEAGGYEHFRKRTPKPGIASKRRASRN